MTRLTVEMALGLLACAGAPRDANPARVSDSVATAPAQVVQPTPTQVLQSWWTAVQARDTATEKRLLADDFIFVDTEGGAHGKAELVAALVDQAVAYQSIASDSVIERVYGNAAVVSERLHTKLRVNGKPLDERARQTTTLVQGNSGWQIVASQGTRFPR